MNRSLTGRRSRWYRGAAMLAVAALPFTMTACSEEDAGVEPGVGEEAGEPLEEEEPLEEDD